MMGHQYGNLQQRINSSGNTLDKEFNHLRKSSKQNNKIKIFRIRAEYNSNTARIIDYISNAYGVGDVNENEKIKMGSSSRWYAGVITNRFKFKDIGILKKIKQCLKPECSKQCQKKCSNNRFLWNR